MSAIAQPHSGVAGCWRRPALPGLAWAVLCGETLAGVLLWGIGLPLTMLGAAPVDSQPDPWPWLPWRIDGAWALIGGIAWACLVSMLVGTLVTDSIERRGFHRPSVGWVSVSIGVAGYGATLLSSSIDARVLLAVLIGTVAVRQLAFDGHDRVRSWRWQPTRRVKVMVILAATLVAFSYGVTHAFVASGSGGSYTTSSSEVRVGQVKTIDVGLSAMRLPANISSAVLAGAGSSNARIRTMVLSLGNPLEVTSPAELRRIPKAERSRLNLVTKSTKLPFHLPASQTLWISMRVSLRSCHSARLRRLKLHYSVLGMPTVADVAIATPLTLACVK